MANCPIRSLGTNTAFGDNRIKNIEKGGAKTPTEAARLTLNLYNIGESLYKLDEKVNNLNSALLNGNFASTVDKFKNTSFGSSKIIENTHKILTARNCGNVLAVGSGILDVVDADKDKKAEAFTNNACALGSMITAENFMNKSETFKTLEDNTLTKLTTRLTAKGGKWVTVKPILSALVFVAGSLSSYWAGKEIGIKISGTRETDTKTKDNKSSFAQKA